MHQCMVTDDIEMVQHVLLLVRVFGKVVKVGDEAPEAECVVNHGPDGVHLVATDALHPVGPHLYVQPGELGLVNAAADAVRRLQDHQIRDPSVRQPLPRRDPCKTYIYTCMYLYVLYHTVCSKQIRPLPDMPAPTMITFGPTAPVSWAYCPAATSSTRAMAMEGLISFDFSP